MFSLLAEEKQFNTSEENAQIPIDWKTIASESGERFEKHLLYWFFSILLKFIVNLNDIKKILNEDYQANPQKSRWFKIF